MGAFADLFLLLVHNQVGFSGSSVSGLFFCFFLYIFHQTFFRLKPIFCQVLFFCFIFQHYFMQHLLLNIDMIGTEVRPTVL